MDAMPAAGRIAQNSYFEQWLGGLFCGDGPLAHRHDQVSDLEEFGRLFAVVRASPRNRALFLTAYRHGLRASEVGLLRTDDIDFRALRIMVHRLKGSHSGTHPMQPDEAKALRAYLRGQLSPRSPILFPSNRGDPIARRTPLRYPAESRHQMAPGDTTVGATPSNAGVGFGEQRNRKPA